MKAFLSHSSSDKDIVRPIANLLGRTRCIFDENSFEAGYPTLQEIFRTLDESDLFVLFISRKALDSEWVKQEINYASKKLNEGEIKRIIPIIIEKGITYKSDGIPEWLRDDYNLRYISSPTIIYNKIDMRLKALAIESSSFNKQVSQIFVGRNQEIADFESDINNIEGWVPRFIVAHSFYEGMGRRTFLKQAMTKTNLVRTPFMPRIINMEHDESIETFIIKLLLITPKEFKREDFSAMSYGAKIRYAIDILRETVDNHESVFIADNGTIVQPNGILADWFKAIIQSPDFGHELVCCLLSKYRPKKSGGKIINLGLSYDIKELSRKETQSLFVQMLRISGCKVLTPEQSQTFLERLKGIPNQVKFAVAAIKDNLYDALKNIKEITQYADEYSRLIVESIQKDERKFQILLLLSQVDIVKQDLVYIIFNDSDLVTETLAEFLNYSIIDFYYGGYEYIRLSPTIADYIDRCRYTLKPSVKSKLVQTIKNEYSDDLDKMMENDYSRFLISLQEMVKNHEHIPAKYYIPSFMLKCVIREYDRGKYLRVIDMCTTLIEDKNSDESIMRELTYYLELSYAREQDAHFFDYIDMFNETDRHFLLGFYYRNNKGRSYQLKAQKEFEQILGVDPTNKKAKRELVNTLLSLEDYDQALEYAQENYEADKNNAFHIQSYFAALIRRQEPTPEEIIVIENLLDTLRLRQDKRAKDFYICMVGEFEYYINHNYSEALDILRRAKVESENQEYINRAINRIEKEELKRKK